MSLENREKAAVEAVLMVIDEPVTDVQLAATLTVPVERVRTLLAELVADYDGISDNSALPGENFHGSQGSRGFELREVAGGWRIYSRPEFADVVSRFIVDGQTARLTQASLETLAVIAYKQPISRARISAIRGVNVDSVVRTLLQRGLIQDSGIEAETGATLYTTTSYFMERLGIGTIEELPKLAPHLPEIDELSDFDPAY